ncbi:MAG TPA: TetR/AcrR family transcriptional regulator [Candidatus Omnitrophota bacterium]|nr:TetR/AcrR family transcriptional regulator [Candidatus Omnitrophota bacterium]HPT06697.1 TetR/AcrR family transcriptional regulator [Candidatus Omnitrophota bacterium]
MVQKECTLREKKYARTKLAIMNAFMERLKCNRYEDISIKQICADAELAQGTFFNYFPEKIDVIVYYLSLIKIKLIWQAEKEVHSERYLPLIDVVFGKLSEVWNNDNLAYQIISVLIAETKRPRLVFISALEKKMAFPQCDGIEDIQSEVFDVWFKKRVELALKNGELPVGTNPDDVVISLMTIITGTILAIRFKDGDRGYHYKRQLQLLWKGLGVKGAAK